MKVAVDPCDIYSFIIRRMQILRKRNLLACLGRIGKVPQSGNQDQMQSLKEDGFDPTYVEQVEDKEDRNQLEGFLKGPAMAPHTGSKGRSIRRHRLSHLVEIGIGKLDNQPAINPHLEEKEPEFKTTPTS